MAAVRGQVRPGEAGKRVATLRLRVTVRDVPEGAVVRVTDVLLQAGTVASGWVPSVTELPWTQGVVGG